MRKRAQPKKPALSRTEFILVRSLLVLAFAVSFFLAWSSIKGGGVPGCGPESDCDKVLSSRWAYWFGLPTSLLALPVYTGLLVLLFQKKIYWKAILPLAFAVLFAAIWFTGVQAFALKAFCKYCMAAHIAGAFAALVLFRRNPLNAGSTGLSISAGAAASALLVIGQFGSRLPAPTIVHTSTIDAAPSAPAVPVTGQTFTIVNGQFTLNLEQVPVSGSVDAPKKMVKLFDYTCYHCRDLHHALKAFQKIHPGQLAVIMLPVPLDSACNPLMTRTAAAHQGACEYARLALAVFYSNSEKFEEFTNWLFAGDSPPPLQAARNQAENLVGASVLQETLAKPILADRLAEDVKIYGANSQLARNRRLPQMIFEHGSSIGGILSYSQLEEILAQNLGIDARSAFTPP